MSVYRAQDPDAPDSPLPVAGGAGPGLPLQGGGKGPALRALEGALAEGRGGWLDRALNVWKGLHRLLDDFGVVLGSENIYVASKDLPKPLSYAAYVALSKGNRQVIALGDKARALLGREPQNIEVVQLLAHGIPENPAMFGDFLLRIVRKHFRSVPLLRPRILVSGNFKTPLMKQVCTEGLLRIKARDVIFCEPEIAAAVGMGLDIMKPDLQSVLIFEKDWLGFMIMSMGGSLTRLRMDVGFDDLLKDILIYFEETADFAPRTDDLAEQFLSLGFAGSPVLIGWEAWVDQVGRGKQVQLEVSPEQFRKAVTPTLLRIKHAVNQSLQGLSREQRYTVQSGPTYLAGEYADLPGLRELLEGVFGRQFLMPENPHHALARGLVNLIPNIDMLRAIDGAAAASRIDF